MKLATLIFAILTVRAALLSSASGQDPSTLAERKPPPSISRPPSQGSDKSVVGPQCEVTQAEEMTILCTYAPAPPPSSGPKDAVRIVLNRAKLSFETDHESHMLVELEFTNEGRTRLLSVPTLSLAIDGDTGRNLVRRGLPHVDLSKIQSGERLGFSDRFLVGAFPSGHYTISLLISNSGSSPGSNPANLILLSNSGVADASTGLNRIADFTVKRASPPSRK